MTWYMGDTRAALSLNRRTQAEPDVRADPQRLARLIDHEAWYVLEMGDIELAEQLAGEAASILPADVPTRELAMAMGTLGAQAGIAGRTREAVEILERALAIARAANDESSIVTILAYLAGAHAGLGHSREALAAIESAEAALDRTGVDDDFFAVTTNAPWIWLAIGDFEGAIAASRRAMAMSEERGMDIGGGQWLTAPQSEAEYRLGRWDDALATIAGSARYASAPSPTSTQQAVLARIHAGRGDHPAARVAALEALRLARPTAMEESIEARSAMTWVDILGGDAAAAATGLRAASQAWAKTVDRYWRSELAWLAAWSANLLANRRDRGTGDALAELAADAVELGRERGNYRDGIDPKLDLADALLAEYSGRGDPVPWAKAAVQLERVGYLPLAVIARQGEAESHLRAGSPGSAEPAIRRALEHVDAMGATALREPIERLARAARVSLDRSDEADAPSRPTPPADPWGLSTREREVLALVAEGRTNREIGDALFISDKTASVHVTHILVKLGVSSRTEAALLAARAGIAGRDA